ncbi:hypothetical protein ED733_007785 [Metarhizium rileyi]|uniref:Prefoldin subunit 3 n=1 Tax=Metarhizium rileyi (strain RCEF 4871) TaxID=1649241 RepID=A0A5C6GNB7_METRR|nr:hypothetical protein ED733_007785 [Metarhizium rileyi]
MPPRSLPHVPIFDRPTTRNVSLHATGAIVGHNVEAAKSLANSSLTAEGQKVRTNNVVAPQTNPQHTMSNGQRCRARPGGTKSISHSNARNSTRKVLGHMSSSQLFEKVLGEQQVADPWKKRVAKLRTTRLPILLLQEIIRQEEDRSADSGLRELLPTPEENKCMLKHAALAGHSQRAIERYIYILRGRNDDARCKRYLEIPTSVPLFIFHYLIRQSSGISDAVTLQRMIDSSRLYYDTSSMPKSNHPETKVGAEKGLHIDRQNFNSSMRLLAHQCCRLEPRFVVKLAGLASQYIQSMSVPARNGGKNYIAQCDLFNACLQTFRPEPNVQVAQRAMPNAYFWEAQRILLSMSAGLEKPLLISRGGFRAIREVLSGQSKNHAELYSAARHAPTWPPYLQPGHGMDERTEPEDNWSRAISAGMLMQEAGFAKDDADHAMDILQGMTQDGTPTIQQRAMLSRRRRIGTWEASIRATRNAQEAWERFRNSPEEGMKPGLEQYTVMFEKLVLRDVEPDSRISPGDKALNFPTQHEANLAEFERARLRPPSVSELYQHMRLNGVQPGGTCLRILVANTASLETAHQYLRDSTEKDRIVRNLIAEEPDPELLRAVPIGLFAAYIHVCLREQGRRAGNQMMRVIGLAESRLSQEQSRWVPYIWGVILKELSQHHNAMGISLHEQLHLMFRVMDTIEKAEGVQLSTFGQFHKGIRKVIRRQLIKLLAMDKEGKLFVKSPFAQALYCRPCAATANDVQARHSLPQNEIGEEGASQQTGAEVSLMNEARARMKYMFQALVQKELHAREYLDGCQTAPLEAMNSRKDVVQSDHAYDYMLTLGYLGEFEEMGRLLGWLIQQWGQFDVVSSLNEMDEAPSYADFFETLCIFRLVAEPMLMDDRVSTLLQKLADSGLNWTWPDDEAVETYAELHDDTIKNLRRAIDIAWKGKSLLPDDGTEPQTPDGEQE